MPIAIMPNSEEIVLLQMDGLITKEEISEVTKAGIKACKDVYAKQIEALKEKYK